MKNILVIGAAGQIGSELVPALRSKYGKNNVVAADLNTEINADILQIGPFYKLNVLDTNSILKVIKEHQIDTIYNLVALLSARGEAEPQLSWQINMGGLVNLLEISREQNCAIFTPSSIGAFGPSTPKDKTPQDTIQRPNTIYGVTKVAGELLCDYYYKRFGVDARGVRYPGIISNVTAPGGGTTDYAVHIYYEALKYEKFSCFLSENTSLDMMYMPDAVRAAIEVMEADPAKLIHRNCFNVTAMNFTPKEIALEIKKYIPNFTIAYDVDPIRQAIADSWPNSMDDSAAREQWGWKHEYDLKSMTKDMLDVLQNKL
ncbi:MAG: L-threonine 3-dehydrogenase [Candidatus Cloacimonadales bacterium]|nr:L-threonine 3-dehydrogenase [Candidatus Cloacimonadota bacterium]MDD2650617.1 L-threonine 3-dehydrogenase [Candidatus Cloacimonadota bacterium]MDD3501936.1 L-threonine 3-dehydrogenase [Candidatus Cloacimonadota bacterium]MDX9976554.1 L-threonine 3-dehydrogenase [Candidatus Cloacimonadales bacterium]